LAELLVVLGVIGIVAMLTIPALMQSYQKKAWVTQLQKSMSMWQNGIATMMANEEAEVLNDCEFLAPDKGNYTYSGLTSAAGVEAATNVLKNYFKITKYEIFPCEKGSNTFWRLDGNGYGSIWNSCHVKLYMADGSTAYWMYMGGSGGGSGSIAIDVNRDKEPNTIGRDVFVFIIENQKGLMPLHSSKHKEELNACSWSDASCATSCGVPGSSDVTGVIGYGCAARIIDEGWVMNSLGRR